MKTYTMKHKEVMIIFEALHKFPVKKRADLAPVASLNKKIYEAMECEETRNKDAEIKKKYWVPSLDDKGEQILSETGDEIGFYDDTRKAEMMIEIWEIDVNIDINTSESKVIIRALDSAMKQGIMAWPINAEILNSIFAKLEE